MLADDASDLAVVGCVPLTGALATLEDPAAEGAVGPRLAELWRRTAKPWVAVVDSGPLYDPLAGVLEAGGIPVFRTADRAVRMLGAWAAWQRGGLP